MQKMSMNRIYEPVNPFRFDYETPWLRYLQIPIALVTLVPFRIVMFMISCSIVYVSSIIITFGLPKQADKYDITGYRNHIQRFIVRYCFKMCRVCLGIRITRKGRPVEKDEAPVLVFGPHSTIFDNLIADQLPQQPFPWTIVASDYMNDFTYRIFRCIGSIFVDRQDRNSTSNVIKQIKQRASDPAWPQLMIWPEGTTHNRLGMMKFKNGAFYPGVPVQPMTCKWVNDWDTFTWCFLGPPMWKLLLMTLCQFTVNVELNFLEPVIPTEEEKENPTIFAERVRKLMADSLEVPTLNLTHEDGLAHIKAVSFGLPGHVANINIEHYRKVEGLSRAKIYEELEQFSILSQQKELADYDNLCSFLSLPISRYMKELFTMYDIDGMFCFTFKSFLNTRITHSFLIAERTNYGKLMECLDADQDGAISLDDLQAVLPRIFGGNLEIYSQIWEKHSNGRKVIDLVDLKRICYDYPEYAILYDIYNQVKHANESRISG